MGGEKLRMKLNSAQLEIEAWTKLGNNINFLYIPVTGSSSWRSGVDLGQLYDNATPSPTGSLSGPYFVESPGKTVIGVRGKTSNLACSIKNLGNLTVIRKTKEN